MELLGFPLTTVATAIAVILLTVIYYFLKNKNVLPGPYGVPYLGLYPFLKEDSFYRQLDEYKKQYGDVFSFTYSGKLFINLGSLRAMREFHVNHSDCFMERMTEFNILTYLLGNGVIMINGEAWKVLRKYFIQRFKDYGLNTVRDNMAAPVYDSLNDILEDLKAAQGTSVNIVSLLTQRCTVTLRKVIFGEGITDEELLNVNSAYAETIGVTVGVNLLLMGPFARLLFTTKREFRKCLNGYNKLCKILRNCVKKIESTMNEETPTCIIEDYYSERNKRRRNNDSTWKIFNDDTLVESILQFTGDGIVGVAASIGGFLNALTAHPEEQDKLYVELMEVVGPNRQPALEDKPNLPYFNGFINEVQRESGIINIFPSLKCTKETLIRGYRIPKGSITLLNFWSAHHDPNTFKDPFIFSPSRYLSDDKKSREESPLLFGIGKRSCSGEPFVMAQSFLFLATIVKNFKIVSSSDSSATTADFFMTGKLDLTFQPRAEN